MIDGRFEILTPETHPDHHAIGQYFAAWDGDIYYCDSYDPRIGFWMTSLDKPGVRRNVSERALGRTLHRIHTDDGRPRTALGGWSGAERFPALHETHRATLNAETSAARYAGEAEVTPSSSPEPVK